MFALFCLCLVCDLFVSAYVIKHLSFSTVERQRKLVLEQQKREQEAERWRQQQMLEEQQRAHNENMRQLEETRRREQERIQQENQRMMEARLRVRL